MYLKRIELQGFKSFPEKIRLDFNRGITAVVGPNGSGKSNIADAVRWVLGEQSAKSLRGAKMEDVIFAGTANRRPLGFAEVSLVIDNADARLPLAFAEVSITRRVYRSGESEYQINGAACRLRDIHEMFMDTGIGKEGYSIIGQGRIEEILSTRSEDRRVLFEEAAGIVKYKNRKHETEQRLDRERANLVRVGDIIAELEQQLPPLRAQSEKAKAYLSLKERLKLLQINVFLHNADRTGAELQELDEKLSVLADQSAAEDLRQNEYATAIDGFKDELDRLADELRRHDELLSEARVKAESCEGEAKLNTEQIRNIEVDIERLSSEAETEKGKISALAEMLAQEQQRSVGLGEELAQAEAKLQSRQKAFEEVSRRMDEREQQIERFNAEIISRMQTAADTRAEEQKAQAAYERLQEIKENLNEDRAENRSKHAENTARLVELENALSKNEAVTEKAETDLQQLLQEKDDNGARLSQREGRLTALRKELNESASRHKLLTELENGYEGYQNSVKAVLTHKRRFSGLCGAVVELLEVEEQYETAIEIALGAAAQNIVTRTEADAAAAIEYLKENREGRATFLPLTAIQPRELDKDRGRLLAEPGVCGTAKELIRYDAEYESIFSSLLGRVLVVDHLQNAMRLAKKYRYAYKLVTLEGELLNPGGAMTGGSSHRVMSLFSRSRERKELKKRLVVIGEEVAVLENELQGLRNQLAIIREQTVEKRETLQQAALARATLTQSAEQTRELVQSLEKQALEFTAKDEELMERLRSMNTEVRAYETKIAENEREIGVLHTRLDAFQSTMVTEKEEKEEGIRVLLEAKARISGLEQNLHAARENIGRMEAEISNTQRFIDRHYADIDRRLNQKTQTQNALLTIRQQAEELQTRQTELIAALARLADDKTEKSAELSRLEQEEREQLTVIAGLQAENVRLSMKREQVVENSRQLYDEMWDEYGITYQTATKFERLPMPVAQLTREERAVKTEIQGLGDVHVGAIEEYRAVKERYEFLTTQREDIITAEAKLLTVVAELTELMERQFTEQFRLISENFAFVFREMFGGGDAYLKLSDEKNVLEAGIDIIAQPPGKTLQSMSLLSGGERALTATALLFGILRMKPSPFCVLDEVEAALDDSNVVRYAQYLKNFSDETQFILITHRKGTMEAADVLYGVTMQEQGVSKLVSVRFAE